MEKLRTIQIMMSTVRYVASGVGLRKFQAARFLFHRVYITKTAGLMLYSEIIAVCCVNHVHTSVCINTQNIWAKCSLGHLNAKESDTYESMYF
jgi:hypothetical protein